MEAMEAMGSMESKEAMEAMESMHWNPWSPTNPWNPWNDSHPSNQPARQHLVEPEQKALWGQVSVSESFRTEKDVSISRLNARVLGARCWGRGWCESMETME